MNPQTLEITPMETAPPPSMPLRPADIESQPGGRARHGQRDELDGVLEHEDGPEPERPERGAEGRDGLRHRDHGRERQRDGQPRRIRRRELVDQVGQPDVGHRGDDRVGVQRDEEHHADRLERHPRAALGSSTPDLSARAFSRSSRSQSQAATACRVGRSNAAGCRSGRTRWRASLPSPARAAEAARSTPAASAVATRICQRSAAMADSSATVSAPPKSPNAGARSGRTTIRVASSRRCATWCGAGQRCPRCLPGARRRSRQGRGCRSGRPVASVTSSASRWDAIPAATTGSTETPARSASRVTKASCSTWARRPSAGWGVSPRYHEDQAEAAWPSQASAGPSPAASARLALSGDHRAAGLGGPWRIPLASTPRSARASATWATVRRPVGEPNSR